MGMLLDRAAGRLKRLPFFSTADYALLNADLARPEVDLAKHALLYGCAEKRRVFKLDAVARAWGEALLRVPAAANHHKPGEADLPSSVSVHVSSWSPPAVRDLAECMVRDLVSRGGAAEVRTQRAVPTQAGEASIIVAPHDFFRLGLGSAWRGTALARSSLMLNTAAPTSEDFTSALPFLLAGRGLLDFSAQMVGIFARAGVPATWVRPSLPFRDRWLRAEDAEHPLVQALPSPADPLERVSEGPRAIDLCCTGPKTAWSSELLARMAPELAGYRTFLHLTEDAADRIERKVLDRARFRIAGHVASRSRLSLHVTECEIPCFDWHSALQAMAAGAVVVTNRAAPHDEFAVGTHLFQEDSRHLPDLIAWLLDDPQGRAAAETARSLNRTILSNADGAATWVDRAASLWSGS